MKTETTLLLEPTIDDPLLAGVVEGSIDDLTQATRPAFLNNTDTPLSWGPDDWKAMDSTRADIFDLKAIERQFDPERYLSEGYIILEEINDRPGKGGLG